MKIFLSIVVLVASCSLYASDGDTIIIRKDARLDALTARQILLNKRSSMLTSSGQYKGFRIQVVSTTNREQAFKIKTDLLSKYPTEKSYVMFQSPYFKVRIGNFIKRDEAEKFRRELNRQFPQGVFIVEDAIEYTPPPDDELLQ